MQLTEVHGQDSWDDFVAKSKFGHPLQLWAWGETKKVNGWTPHRLALTDGNQWLAGAQVLLWRAPGLNQFVAYVPRGPAVDPKSELLGHHLKSLVEWGRDHNAFYVRIEPAWLEAHLDKGWLKAKHQIQLAQTYTINLLQTEEQLLAVMGQKHRQYIRKSERNGVVIRRTQEDLNPMLYIYKQTAKRAGFGIHADDYYRTLHRQLGDRSYLYYAHYQNEVVAFLWLAVAGQTAYELYGGVTETGQNIKANYALKWRAICEMKAAGFAIYDFNGRLNEGVSHFKEGFGPAETNYIGTWDYPISAVKYHLWEKLWPVAKVVGRKLSDLKRGRSQSE